MTLRIYRLVVYWNTPRNAFNRPTAYGGGEADPWDQGLGVLDMSELVWRDSYDPDLGTYTTPSIIKDYIKLHGPYPPEWDNDVVKSWFVAEGQLAQNSLR